MDITNYWGELAALGTASCWTLASLIFTLAGRRIGSFNLNKLRMPIAIVLLSSALLITGQFDTTGQLHRSGYAWLALSGVIGLVLGDSAYFRCLVLIGPRRATLLMSAAPVMAALIAWPFLGESLPWVAWLGIFMTVGGIAWVTAEREYHANNVPKRASFGGILLGLGGAAGQAVGIVIAKHVLVESDIAPLYATFVRMIAATSAIWLYATLRGQVRSTVSVLRDRKSTLIVAAGATLGPFIGVWLSLVAVKRIEAGVAATIMATMPILILPLVVLVYKEKVSARAVFGALIAVGGIALLFLR